MLSIIVPTYNEKENIKALIQGVFKALAKDKIKAEVIVIDDDSLDGTAAAAEELSKTYPVRVFLRKGKKGLGSAIIDGINLSIYPVICVMDADLSHPPEAIPEMYHSIEKNQAQLVIGSRKVAGGGTSEWIWYRKFVHWVARGLGSFITPVKDLTSGFFMFNKNIIKNVNLEPKSWKIGLEIMVKGKYDKFLEYPIIFKEREFGKSKMGAWEVFAYLNHLISLTKYKILHKDNRCPKD